MPETMVREIADKADMIIRGYVFYRSSQDTGIYQGTLFGNVRAMEDRQRQWFL